MQIASKSILLLDDCGFFCSAYSYGLLRDKAEAYARIMNFCSAYSVRIASRKRYVYTCFECFCSAYFVRIASYGQNRALAAIFSSAPRTSYGLLLGKYAHDWYLNTFCSAYFVRIASINHFPHRLGVLQVNFCSAYFVRIASSRHHSAFHPALASAPRTSYGLLL